MNQFQRFTGLQKMMLRWEAFHPVNAVHVVFLKAAWQPSELTNAVRSAFQSLGIGPLEIRNRHWFRYVSTGPSLADVEVQQTPPTESLSQTMEFALNEPFPSGPHWPFRFQSRATPDGGTILLVTYRHLISDAFGIAYVLKSILRELFGLKPCCQPLNLDPPPLATLFPRQFGVRGFWRQRVKTLSEIVTSRSCLAFPEPDVDDHHMVVTVPPSGISTAVVTEHSREREITVQELLYAALIEALGLELSEHVKSHPHRDRISVYCPTDLRRLAPETLATAFGQCLGGVTVRAPFRLDAAFSEILRAVTTQTEKLRITRSDILYDSQMRTMAAVWDCLPQRINRFLGPTLVPLTGFISNVNLSSLLAEELTTGQVGDYVRATGTGLMVPLMLGVTTLGESLSLSATHRKGALSQCQVDRICQHVRRRLMGEMDETASFDEYSNLNGQLSNSLHHH